MCGSGAVAAHNVVLRERVLRYCCTKRSDHLILKYADILAVESRSARMPRANYEAMTINNLWERRSHLHLVVLWIVTILNEVIDNAVREERQERCTTRLLRQHIRGSRKDLQGRQRSPSCAASSEKAVPLPYPLSMLGTRTVNSGNFIYR